ncbi:hypothetical protein HHI36_015886 [Cryptolaemus montrouzieri]|uniref:Major facilitator superfamily (MFS) profile domain-containing protein n=1 Tax=Cryptolaemus montrouzieri TaxID=559131 RepID=A0ABD2N7A0_9CUCU
MAIDSDVCSIIVSAFQTATCLIVPIASTKFNRKTLLYISCIGISFSTGLMSLYFNVQTLHNYQWLALLSLISYVIFYNCGAGPLPWVILGELYPAKVKSIGTSTSNCIYWIVQFVLSYLFDEIDLGIWFSIFCISCLITVAFIWKFVLETKGKTLQEIQRTLEGKHVS